MCVCELVTSPYLSGTAVSVGEACIKRNIPSVPKLSVASKNCETVYPVPLGSETVCDEKTGKRLFIHPCVQLKLRWSLVRLSHERWACTLYIYE